MLPADLTAFQDAFSPQLLVDAFLTLAPVIVGAMVTLLTISIVIGVFKKVSNKLKGAN